MPDPILTAPFGKRLQPHFGEFGFGESNLLSGARRRLIFAPRIGLTLAIPSTGVNQKEII
jgi:hypothetical protein